MTESAVCEVVEAARALTAIRGNALLCFDRAAHIFTEFEVFVGVVLKKQVHTLRRAFDARIHESRRKLLGLWLRERGGQDAPIGQQACCASSTDVVKGVK